MATLAEIKIDLSKINKSTIFEGKNGAKYYTFQIAINDETSQYGDNISASEVQTKEQREAKEKKSFIGGGKVFWTDGTIKTATKKDEVKTKASVNIDAFDDLPF